MKTDLLQAQLNAAEAAEAAATAAGELQEIAGVESELRQQAPVLFRVDLTRQLLVGLADLIALTALAEQVENHLLGDLHDGECLR